MKLSSVRLQKEKKVAQIRKQLVDTQFLLLLSHSQLKVSDFQKLKKDLRQHDQAKNLLQVKIYKNTFLAKAFSDTSWQELIDVLVGPLFVIMGRESSLAVIKSVFQFVDRHKMVDFKAGFFDQQFLNADQLQELALLPTKEELLARLINTLRFSLFYLLITLKTVVTDLTKSVK